MFSRLFCFWLFMNASAIIVAAGEGLRIGGKISKPYLPLCGRAMVLRTLDRFFTARSIGQVVLVAAAGELSRCEGMLRADSLLGQRPWVLQSGGATRQQSVKAGLEKIGGDADIVVIHDGARPFVSPALIDRCAEAAYEKGAVVVGVAARNTIKVVSSDGRVQATPARSGLWEIQTPQAFRREVIVEAHEWATREGIDATDDASLVEQMGKPVFVMDGERTNIKITTPEDICFAEALIRDGRIP
jgi:2-C-methyl-D-erythritol 4-phosphate cytidylyltransferase/2-C-methyl-D-erythritol 4-phosphate cytidylyltransferase/2-C-methyl-D-erythritol 2,4-cyclodiphosphate synthase